MFEASKKLIIDKSCCAGYKEFTFFVDSQEEEVSIYNNTASNYIHGEVTYGMLTASVDVTFPSLIGSNLNEKSIQVISTEYTDGTKVNIAYNTNNIVGLVMDTLPYITGIFTIRIWTDQVELI